MPLRRTDEPQLSLPPDPSSPQDAGAADAEAGAQTEKAARILIVEDDYLIAMQAESALTDAGFNVVGVAATAEEALEGARAYSPVLAIMDIRLAGKRDGVDAAGDLFRELGLRCVFVTAHEDRQVRARAEPFAPLGWLTKPYSMVSLVSAVRQAILRRG
jgi:DNA-binding NarL/FixJ family response regulator